MRRSRQERDQFELQRFWRRVFAGRWDTEVLGRDEMGLVTRCPRRGELEVVKGQEVRARDDVILLVDYVGDLARAGETDNQTAHPRAMRGPR